ncbi:uncharacterized PurR-regulated membrane protein YhhQ (DUF165 family) [Pseudomonas laurylsulfatiphila]
MDARTPRGTRFPRVIVNEHREQARSYGTLCAKLTGTPTLMLFLITYISSVVLINFAFSTAPHLDIIWSAWGGLVFILRDMVQTRFGHGALVAMLVALVLSYATSDPSIALASATAFAVSECIDWLVFSITKRPLHDRLWISSALSIPLDTFIFFGMIDALTPGVILTALGSKFAGVTAVWLIMAWRLRKQAVVS